MPWEKQFDVDEVLDKARALPRAVVGVSALALAVSVLWFSPASPASDLPIRFDTQLSPEPLFSDAGSALVVSPDGTRLAYIVGDGNRRSLHIRTLDQLQGSPLSGTEEAYHPFFSPDGKWVGFVTRSELKKVSFSGGAPLTLCPVNISRGASWAPDGQRVVFSADTSGATNIYWKRADGSGETERLTDNQITQWASSFSPDGKHILFHQSNSGTASDIFVLPLSGERKPEVFLQTPFTEAEAAFSHDGRWVAYQSNESGTVEIYVRPFPSGSGKWQISTNGGRYARWSPDGRELYYRNDDGLAVVSVDPSGESFIADKPRQLFDGPFLSLSIYGSTLADYDVSPDGKRFVMMQGEEQLRNTKVTVVFNWFEVLKKTFSAGGS